MWRGEKSWDNRLAIKLAQLISSAEDLSSSFQTDRLPFPLAYINHRSMDKPLGTHRALPSGVLHCLPCFYPVGAALLKDKKGFSTESQKGISSYTSTQDVSFPWFSVIFFPLIFFIRFAEKQRIKCEHFFLNLSYQLHVYMY